jgi:hypothetical protein
MGAPGCDDAPIVEVKRGDMRKDFVCIVMPYYDNPQFFEYQMRRWWAFNVGVRLRLGAIIVDDGSPTYPAGDVLRGHPPPIAMRLFRIDVDVRWNWLAARNIGMKNAPDCWCVLTDMDHVIPFDTAKALIHGEHDPNIIYRFSRRERDGGPIHPHPNSWFMTRRMFWKVGGYDEALSGHYGTDGEYRRRCAATAPIRIMTDELHRYEHYEDSSTTRYKRKQPEDAGVKQMIRARGPNWKPKVLSFPHHEIKL